MSLVLVSFASLPLPARALGKLTDLSVFSDSLLDSGNAGLFSGGAFPPSPPYANGGGGANRNRASNGPVAVDYLWNLFNPGDSTFAPSGGLASGSAEISPVALPTERDKKSPLGQAC